MEFIDVINKRGSCRSYVLGHEVSEEIIQEILDVAMKAPSSHNSRPFTYGIILNRQLIEEMVEIHPYCSFGKNASFLIMAFANEKKFDYFEQDMGASIENLLLAITDKKLGACWCGIYPKEKELVIKYQEMLKTDLLPIGLITVGKPSKDVKTRGYFDENSVIYYK